MMEFTQHKDNAARRKFSDFPANKQAKLLAGSLLAAVLPKTRASVENSSLSDSSSRLERLVRNGLYATAFRRKDHRKLRNYFSQYWGSEAAAFHEGWDDRFDRMFLQHDVQIVDELEKLMGKRDSNSQFQHLYEIGCGGGQVLSYMRDRFPGLETLTGIDLGAEQIEKNQEANTLDSVEFDAADATEWIPANAERNCILMTNGGVFEYFLQEELEDLFSFAAENLAPAAICIIETIGTDHDLEKETNSLIYGRELAFSHNYPHLLSQAGFSIVSQSERDGFEIDGGGRWIRVLAVRE